MTWCDVDRVVVYKKKVECMSVNTVGYFEGFLHMILFFFFIILQKRGSVGSVNSGK